MPVKISPVQGDFENKPRRQVSGSQTSPMPGLNQTDWARSSAASSAVTDSQLREGFGAQVYGTSQAGRSDGSYTEEWEAEVRRQAYLGGTVHSHANGGGVLEGGAFQFQHREGQGLGASSWMTMEEPLMERRSSLTHGAEESATTRLTAGRSQRSLAKQKIVMVAIKIKLSGSSWGSSSNEIDTVGQDLLHFALTYVVKPGDAICVVTVDKQADVPREIVYNRTLRLQLEELLHNWILRGDAMRVRVIVVTPVASKTKAGLVQEVQRSKPHALLLGNRPRLVRGCHHSGAYFVQMLPPTCRIHVVRKGVCIFEENGQNREVFTQPALARGRGLSRSPKLSGVAPLDDPAESQSSNTAPASLNDLGFQPTPAAPTPQKDEMWNLGEMAYSYDEIRAGTENFCHPIGTGGCGTVYFGYLRDQPVAVKRLKNSWGFDPSSPAYLQLLTEIRVMRNVSHKNLMALKGLCVEKGECFLVCDYMENGSVDTRLRDMSKVALTWRQRMRIALGSARALQYLHEDCRTPLVHRDVKTANILLDRNLEPLVADFGLAKLVPTGQGTASPFAVTEIMGTKGYLDPEYGFTCQVSELSDVFAFGVVLWELITGQQPFLETRDPPLLSAWGSNLTMQKEFSRLVDPRLAEYSLRQVALLAQLATCCTARQPADRPPMKEVIKILEATEMIV